MDKKGRGGVVQKRKGAPPSMILQLEHQKPYSVFVGVSAPVEATFRPAAIRAPGS